MKHIAAIIGFGGMGNWHRKSIAGKMENLHIKGVYDIRQEAMEKAAAEGLIAYESAEQVCADAEVELVIIATPNNFHKQYAIACMQAGKKVVCEKPVAMHAGELEEMIAVSRETGMLFSIHQNRRWDKDYLTVKSILEEGKIGTPYFIESRVQGSRRAMHGWRSYRENGGGMVLDWGVHLIDQALALMDSPVVSVDAHLFSIFTEEVEDNLKVFLRFENGVSYQLEMSTNCFINQPRWHVSCTEGTAVVENWECDGKIVMLKEDSAMEWADDIVYTAAGPTRTMAPRPAHTKQEMPLPVIQSDSIDYYHNILAVLEGREELLVKPEQALRVMKVIDLVFESQKTGHGMSCHI